MGYELQHRIFCDQGAVRAVRFNVDGEYCLTSGSNKTVKLWNPVKKSLLRTYSGHGNEVLDAKSSCDNNNIISCGADKSLLLWEVGTGKIVRNFRGCHAGAVNCVCFSEDSSVAVSGSVDSTVKCWDLRSKRAEPIQTLRETSDTVTSLDVSDHEILVGCADCKLIRYDLRNGLMVTDLVGSNAVTSARFSSDGQSFLVSLCRGESIRLFDKSSGELLQEYEGHSHKGDYRIEAVLDESDTRVLSGSEDGTVCVWSLIDAKVEAKLCHDPDTRMTVHSLSHHPEKPQLISAARADIYLWQRGPG